MNKILLLAASDIEMAAFFDVDVKKLTSQQLAEITFDNIVFNYLVTGIGQTNTTYFLTKALQSNSFNLIINIGIAGSFDLTIPLGDTVIVAKDTFADLGAEDHDEFLDQFELNLANEDILYRDKFIFPIEHDFQNRLSNFKSVTAITANTAHGNQKSIELISKKWDPQIESMEGASVLQVARLEHIPCIQIKVISNYVEPRNRNNWRLDLAFTRLKELKAIIASFY